MTRGPVPIRKYPRIPPFHGGAYSRFSGGTAVCAVIPSNRGASEILPLLSGAPDPLLGPAIEHRPTARAQIAPMLRHAGGDALHIGNVLVAQAHRVAFAGRALPGCPLRGCRLPHQRKPD